MAEICHHRIYHPISRDMPNGSNTSKFFAGNTPIYPCLNCKAPLWWHISAARYEKAIMMILETFHDNSKFSAKAYLDSEKFSGKKKKSQ